MNRVFRTARPKIPDTIEVIHANVQQSSLGDHERYNFTLIAESKGQPNFDGARDSGRRALSKAGRRIVVVIIRRYDGRLLRRFNSIQSTNPFSPLAVPVLLFASARATLKATGQLISSFNSSRYGRHQGKGDEGSRINLRITLLPCKCSAFFCASIANVNQDIREMRKDLRVG